ncbi:MAG: ABC transporter ATP-binding protein [Caldilineae bacterium]|nr:MAG: ABC transporter ATP-binding protein [Caldilineae bacterium]
MTDLVIETHNLTKKYGDFTAVDGLNLQVRAGEVFGILGPNGSGKTTTILMLLGLTEPTSGSVQVLGFDPVRQPLRVKSQVGYMPDSIGFYDELTARENLIYIAKLNGIPRAEAYARIDQALERVGLHDVANLPVGAFSRGMRQRLGVADVLIKQPKLIIMDEPTQGLDPAGAQAFLDLIRSLKSEDITILLSSHLLHQVQAVCDRVGFFRSGRMFASGSIPELAREVLGGAYRIQVHLASSGNGVAHALEALDGVVQVRPLDGRGYELETRDDIRPQVARAVVNAGGDLLHLEIEQPNLDEIYARYFQQMGQEVNHGGV